MRNETLFGAYTDRGAVRPENQDSVFCRKLGGTQPQAAQNRSPFSVFGFGRGREKTSDAVRQSELILAAVCDGIGGLERGDIASGIVVGEMDAWMDRLNAWVSADKLDAEVLFSHFRDAAEYWNTVLIESVQRLGIHSGTTMSAILAVDGIYGIVHVGDSRVYRYRPTEGIGTKLLLLTEDESVVRVKDGKTRSFLENFVGRQEPLSFRFYQGAFAPGDMLFACSDGFCHHLTEQDAGQMYAAIASGISPADAAADAVQTMIERGERDNLSAAIVLWGGCAAENMTGIAAADADADVTMI